MWYEDLDEDPEGGVTLTYDQIMDLLDRGMTVDQIMGVINAQAPEPEPVKPAAPAAPAPAPAAPAETDGNAANAAILAAIDKLTKSVQAAALFNARQPDAPKPQTEQDILLDAIKSRSGTTN